MTDDALVARYAFARKVAREAGRLALDWRRHSSGFAPEEKSAGDWVTAADRDVERFIRERIAAIFPGDDILGEEGGGTLGPCAWVLDPIDGTSNYVHGLPFWCVSIGVMIEGSPTIGVLDDPTHGVQYHGLKGAGAVRSETGRPDKALSVSGQMTLEHCTLGFAHQTKRDIKLSVDAYVRLARAGSRFRALGSGALHIALVAEGVLDGFYESAIHLWDVAAAAVLVEEAGGWIRAPFDPDNPLTAFPVIAGTPGIRTDFEEATEAFFT